MKFLTKESKELLIKYKEELKQGVSVFLCAAGDNDDLWRCSQYLIPFLCSSLNVRAESLLKGAEWIPDGMFYMVNLKSFITPPSINKICGGAFLYTYIKDITITGNVQTIEQGAFNLMAANSTITILNDSIDLDTFWITGVEDNDNITVRCHKFSNTYNWFNENNESKGLHLEYIR